MIRIVCDDRIEYTKGDSFSITITPDEELAEGSTLRFVIAKDEESAAVVDNTYSLNSYGEFTVALTATDIAALDIGDYIYKLTVTTVDGKICTSKSGDFIVKWGV